MKKLFIISSLIFFSLSVLATGPSHVFSRIRPISINDKGEVLCITEFTKNEMGAHRGMPVEYGLCVLKDKQIDYYRVYQLKDEDTYDDRDFYWPQRHRWIKTFERAGIKVATNWFTDDFKSKYSFTENNIKPYKKNIKTTVKKLVESRNIDIKASFQLALKDEKAYFKEEDMNNEIEILYDFGNVLILKNKRRDETEIGVGFNYYNWLFDGEVGFEDYDIDGILFLD